MTKPLLTFSTEVLICWEDRRGCEQEAHVDVSYTYDGNELTIKGQRTDSPCYGLSDNQFNELVYEAVAEQADERYFDEVGEDA